MYRIGIGEEWKARWLIVSERLTTLFHVWGILGTIIGIYKSPAVTWLQTDLSTVGLGFLILSMGLTLKFEDFRRCMRNPWTDFYHGGTDVHVYSRIVERTSTNGFLHPATSFLNRAGLMGERVLGTTTSNINSCRLFGVPLTEETHVENDVDLITTPITSPSSTENLNPNISHIACTKNDLDLTSSAKAFGRSCTKVHKQASVIGRAIDLTKLDGYTDLISELGRLFNMEGLLNDPEKKDGKLFTVI